jgi:hypothetical protein
MNNPAKKTYLKCRRSLLGRQIPLVLLASLAGIIAVPSVRAHHSFAAQYDINKPVRLVGQLTKIEWTNPHSYFYLNVTSASGVVTEWTVEGAGPGALSRRGFKKGAIKIGDTLIVDGYLAKSGGKIIDGRRVTLPNGQVVNGGTAGDGGPGSGPAAAPGEESSPEKKAPVDEKKP